MSETHSGGCLCGGVQYVVTGPLSDVINCHCGQCRRTHGHFAGYTEAPLSDFKLESSESLKWYQSSPQARRGFCSICGASLFWVPEGGDGVWIAAGTLDKPTGLRTLAHIFVADAGDYYTIADDLKTYPGTLQYCGVWKSGNAYARGSFVSHSGSTWHSNVDANTAKPGEGDSRWELVVKRGRDASGL